MSIYIDLCSCRRQPTCPVTIGSRSKPQLREGCETAAEGMGSNRASLRLKRCFFGYFLCTRKESNPRSSIAEALAVNKRDNTPKHHPHPNPLPPAGQGKITI